MSSYISPLMAKRAIQKMQIFHNNVRDLYKAFEIDILEDTGRRNIVMSHTQERFFADEISLYFPGTISDGKTGCADILIPELDRELECKLTSGSGKYSSFELQTDWKTLSRKGSLDYLYVLASKEFDKFVVLFFSDLTTDDFFPPAPGSRGRARMNKALGMKKCEVLIGDAEIKNNIRIQSLRDDIVYVDVAQRDRLRELDERFVNTSKNAIRARQKIKEIREREAQRFQRKIDKISGTIEYWRNASPAYSFKFERIDI